MHTRRRVEVQHLRYRHHSAARSTHSSDAMSISTGQPIGAAACAAAPMRAFADLHPQGRKMAKRAAIQGELRGGTRAASVQKE